MIEPTLKFTVAIKADEAVLNNLQQQLNITNSAHSLLGEVLPQTIKETLVAAGTSDDVEIELHPSHLINRYDGTGDFTTKLWLETHNPAYHHDDELIFLKAIPQNEILCSD